MANEIPSMDMPPHVLEYIHEQKTMTLATSSPGAVPLATTLVYVDDGSALYVWTRPDTTTAQHMGQNPLVSFAIDEYASDWQQTKGIQGAGNCQVLSTRPTSTGLSPPSSRSSRRSPGRSRRARVLQDHPDPAPVHRQHVRGRRRGPRHRLPPGSGLQHLPRPAAGGGRDRRGAAADTRSSRGRRDRAPGRARRQVLHRRRRRGRGRPGLGWQDAPLATLGKGQFFGEIAILEGRTSRGDRARGEAHDAVRDGTRRLPLAGRPVDGHDR